ncbi:MAG: VanZ family protein [Cyanobacteria bacterium J06639_18]
MMKSHRFWKIAFYIYIGIISAISISAYLKIIPNEIKQFPYYDTILHFLLMGFSAFLGYLAFNKRKVKINLNTLKFSLPLTPIVISIFILIEECLQIFSPNRSFDLVDLAAVFFGIIVFTWLAEMTPINNENTSRN